VRSSVAQALGQLGSEEALPALSNLFGQEKQSEIVKATAALGLLRLGDSQGYDYLLSNIDNVSYSESYTDPSTYNEENIKLQSTILTGLGRGGDSARKFLLEQFNPKRPVATQVAWIEAFVVSEAKDALPLLYGLLASSNNGRIKTAAQTAIASLESDYPKLLAMTENPKLKVSDRLQALTTLVVKHQQTAIPDLLRLLKADEKLYGRKIWQMLGELKAPAAKDLLETRIEEIKQGYANWRDIRDSEPQIAEEETKEQNPDWKQWKEKLDASKPAYAAYYAHALARIDPETGIKLLQHEIADIRTGAWYGLASLGDINLVKKLTDLRLRSHDQPLLRHAAYRAMDLSLTTIQHNNKPEDLQALEAWYPTLKQQEMQQEEVKTEDELSITPRVDWTIHQISYNLKAKAELQRRYQVFVAEQKTGTNKQNP
jgi:HEAT repeat protein